MENKKEAVNNTFEYTYSAKRQEEIEQIRKKYLPPEEDKLETLRKLDRSAENAGTIVSIVIGIIGTLVMGAGMSLTMVWTDSLLLVGIIVGILGIAILACAYPVYKIVVKKQREKIAPRILALSEELSKM